MRPKTPSEILAADRERALAYAFRAGPARVRKLLLEAQADLVRRLSARPDLRGRSGESFTTAQLRVSLEQVRATLRSLRDGMRREVGEQGREAAEASAEATARYLGAAEKRFRGIARPLRLAEAALVDPAVRRAEASVLRRLEGDPSSPARPGILERYGEAVVGRFEDQLRLSLVARRSWAETREALVEESPFLRGAPARWAERIVRTESMQATNAGSWETIREADRELGGMAKILSATFDDRTAADSYAVHGQIRRTEEPFDTWQGKFVHPPARPNDREIVVPHRPGWPIPSELRPKSDADVLARWRKEGRKGSPPARPKLSTLSERELAPAAPLDRRETLAAAARAEPVAPTAPPVERIDPVGYREHLEARDVQLHEKHGVATTEVLSRVFGDAGAPSVASLERAWGSEALGYSARASEAIVRGSRSLSIEGAIENASGSRVGSFVRSFRREDDGALVVHHDFFKLDPGEHGKGLGEAMLRQSIRSYEQLGVDRIEVGTAWVGSYTWATFGFNWNADEAERRVGMLARFLARHGVEESRAADVAARVCKNAWDVAALDVDGITAEVRVEGKTRREKLGKAFLLDSEGWSGSLRLSQDDPTYRRAKKRLGL